MGKIVHIIGNGDKSVLWDKAPKRDKGLRLVCNLPPFEVQNVFASVMVDFKMMAALTEGSLNLDSFQWVLGTRPKIWMQDKGTFYLKHSHRIREFYTTVPKYAGPAAVRATNFNCGHMASHYAANKLKASEIHLYGFDSLFDHNMRSYTDTVLSSDRGSNNNYRLLNNWRPIWTGIFNEFKDTTKFYLYHTHNDLKIKVKSDNVETVVIK